MTNPFQEECFGIRAACLSVEKDTQDLMTHRVFDGEELHKGQHGEMRANIMLAVRHLEDARIRLGKVVQAFDGGTSVYPK